MATRAANHPNRLISGRSLSTLLVIGTLISVVLYAAAAADSTVSISPPSTTSGGKADVSSVSASFSGVQGKAKKTEGVALAKLTLGDSADSDDLIIQFVWSDSDQASGLLLNPMAFLETAVYFVDSQGSAAGGGYVADIPGVSCNTTTQRTFDDSGTVYVCPDPISDKNFKVLSTQMAVAVFQPTVDLQSVLYVLADIAVPGGAPPGQQSLLTTLDFNVSVN